MFFCPSLRVCLTLRCCIITYQTFHHVGASLFYSLVQICRHDLRTTSVCTTGCLADIWWCVIQNRALSRKTNKLSAKCQAGDVGSTWLLQASHVCQRHTWLKSDAVSILMYFSIKCWNDFWRNSEVTKFVKDSSVASYLQQTVLTLTQSTTRFGGSCRIVCTAARFVTSTSWSRAWSKSGNISTRWSSIKRSGSCIHVFELAFDFEHTVDILNTNFRCAEVLPTLFARGMVTVFFVDTV